MKLLISIIILSVIFLFSPYIHAQFDFGKKIKERIEKELDQATDDAIDETVETVKKGDKDKDKNEDKDQGKKNNDESSNRSIENYTSTEAEIEETFGDSFEGKVIFVVEEEGEKQIIEYYSQNNKYLMEMPEKGGSILFDRQNFKMYVLVHDEKKYMESQMMPMSAGSGGGSISKTGETKNILGYHCEKFFFKQNGRKGEAWMTDELGPFMFFMESQKEMPEWQNQVLDAGYFPLYVKEYDEKRNVESVFNVNEVTPMKLNRKLFEVPSSYEKIDLTNMGGLENLLGQ